MSQIQRRTYVVAYDIGQDDRRERVAELLSAYGPRVQLSVFEVVVTSEREAKNLVERLTALIDPDADQVRLYQAAQDALVLGDRVLEERASYWVITPVSRARTESVR